MMFSSEMALARYETALETGQGWREAAEALAEALKRSPKAKARKADAQSTADDLLSASVKVGRRAKRWGEFTVTWADGSATLVKGVPYDREGDRWAAAVQAADRLRRTRGRHAAWAEIGAPQRWTEGPCGVRIQTQEYERYCRERPLPNPTLITAGDGEAFEVTTHA